MSQAVVGVGCALSAFKDNNDVVFGDVNLSESYSRKKWRRV